MQQETEVKAPNKKVTLNIWLITWFTERKDRDIEKGTLVRGLVQSP